jgi:hypothetical protein
MGDLMGEAVKDDDRPQEIVASYPYVDEDNTAVRYCIDRYGPRKDFKVRPKGVKSHDRVLYNLHWVK